MLECLIQPTSAIETYRKELNVIDQNLPNFVIGESGVPVGTIEDGDSVIFFNFRERALEISESFDQDDFNKFDRIRDLMLCMPECSNMMLT